MEQEMLLPHLAEIATITGGRVPEAFPVIDPREDGEAEVVSADRAVAAAAEIAVIAHLAEIGVVGEKRGEDN